MAADRLAVARSFLGVKFKHQGRNPALGIDCVGLGVLYLRALGVKVHDRTDYGRDPDGSLRAAMCRSMGDPVAEGVGCWKYAQPGDVMSIRFSNLGHVPERHVAIASELYGQPAMIHADGSPSVSKVCEIPLDDNWKRRVIGVWRVA